MGSKFARLAWGTKRRVRAAAPWESAGIERPPVAARLPTPANPFNKVLRYIEFSQSRVVIAVPPLAEGSAPNEVKTGQSSRWRSVSFASKWYATSRFRLHRATHPDRREVRAGGAGLGQIKHYRYR